MRKFAALVLCLSMLVSLLGGCADDNAPYVPTGDALVYDDGDLNATQTTEESAPQEFSLVYYAERSMNPLLSADYTNRALFSLLYQGLFSVDMNNRATPILCKRYQVSSDNRSYTFYIENAFFSDGSRLTINDVLATYITAKESKFYGGRFTHITEIALSGDGGITFTLDTPYQDLPVLLDIPILKEEELEDESPLGTGPYIIEHTMGGAQLRKVANWWCSAEREFDIQLAVTATSIPLIEAESPSHIRDEFEFYDVGLVCADPCSDDYADYRCDYELWDCDNGIFLYLAFNVTYCELFEGKQLRSAVTYAIDRERLAEDHYRGFARAATLPASPGSMYYSNSLASKFEYDSNKFINVLNQQGIIEEDVRLLVNSDDSARLRTARDIAAMLTECGMPTVTMEVNTADFNSYLLAGNYDLYLGQTRLPPNMDLSEFFRPWGNMSYNGISDAALYSRCLDALADYGNYYNLHQEIMEDGRIIPVLFCGYAVYATRGLLTDLTPARDNVFFYSLGKTTEGIRSAAVFDQPEA